MKWIVRHAGLTDRGRVRERNEDRWTADPAFGLYVVTDGMGGHAAGDLASHTVAAVLPGLLRDRLGESFDLAAPHVAPRVRQAVADLSRRLYAESHDQPGLDGMGATVVLALVREGKALIAHLGDSRAYLYREGLFEQLTRDHTLVQVLVDNDEIRPEEALEHPAHGQLIRHVGMEGAPQPDVRVFDLRPDDRLLLCTDGLTDMLADDVIRQIVESGDLDEACRRLVDAANAAGGRDNVTVVMVQVQKVP